MTGAEHRIRWFVYGAPGDRATLIPKTATMRGQWAYEARCETCQVETRTGGAVRRYIAEKIEDHKAGIEHWHPVA